MTNVLQYILKLKDEASGNLNKFEKSLNGAQKASFIFAGGLAAIGTTAAGFITAGAKYAGELESLTIALETVTGSQDEARSAMEKIKQTAKDSPFFETATLAQFVQLMAAAGQKTGQAVETGIAFGDVMAAFGKGNSELGRLGNTLSQVIGKGKADTVDFKELVNSGWVSVRKDVAETMGVTMTALEDMVANGEIGYEQIRKAAEKYTGAAVKQSGTLSALTGRIKESFSTLLADIVVDTGIFDSIKEGLSKVVGFLDKNQDKIKDFIVNSLGWIKENGYVVAGVILGGLVPALGALATMAAGAAVAFATMMIPLLPFIVIGGLIGLAIKMIIDHFGGLDETIVFFTETFNQFKDFMVASWETVKQAFATAIEFIITLPTRISEFFAAMYLSITTWLTDTMTFVITWFTNLPTSIAYWLGFALGTIVQWGIDTYAYLTTNVPIWIESISLWFSELPGKIWVWLTELYTKFTTWGMNTWTYLSTEIPKWVTNVTNWIKELPGKIWAALSDLAEKFKTRFTEAWTAAETEIKSWPSKLMDWGKNIATAFVDGVRNGLIGLKDAFVEGFNKARGSIEGQSPPKEGPLKDIDTWGFNIGDAWVQGMKSAMEGFDLPSNLAAPLAPAYAGGSGTTNNYQTQAPINLTAVINNEMDAVALAQMLGFEVSMRGRY